MPYRTKIRAYVRKKHQLRQALENTKIEYVYTPFDLLSDDFSESDKNRIIISPPEFIGGNEVKIAERLAELKKAGYNRIAVHTLDTMELGKKYGFMLHGWFRLNVLNSLSAEIYSNLGLSDIILSFELNLSRAKKIDSKLPKGIIMYGNLPLMLARRCPVSGDKVCKVRKKECNNTLTDRLGKKLRILCDSESGTISVLNPNALLLSDKSEKLAMFDFGVFLFTDEPSINEVLNAYENNSEIPAEKEFTRGFYK